MTPTEILLSAAAECSVPEQYESIEAMIAGDADFPRRLIGCIERRIEWARNTPDVTAQESIF